MAVFVTSPAAPPRKRKSPSRRTLTAGNPCRRLDHSRSYGDDASVAGAAWSGVSHSAWSPRTSMTRQSAMRPPRHCSIIRSSSRAQRLKALDPSLDIAELRLRDGVRGLAGLFRLVAEAQQVANGLQWEPQLPGVPNECKPAYVLGFVDPLVAFRAGRDGKEADLLVVADRLYLAAGRLRSAADGQPRRPRVFPLNLQLL